MKKQFLLLVAIAVFGTALTTNAYGQTSRIVRVDVKFNFQIGDRLYPAGAYQIESLGRQPNNILEIRSVADADTRQFIVANHTTTRKTQAPKLVFDKYGDIYFLRNIVLESGQWGYSIRPSHRKRESGKDLAARLNRKN